MNDRYQIIEKIAEGGIGAVYRGWDGNLGREVAIKRIRTDGEGVTQAKIDDLVKEARTQSSLQHPNIVTVYDVGVDDEGAYVVMELIKGETLDTIIERGALTEVDFESLVTQTLEGLIAAHAVGLIHLDLKPGNLMISWHASGKFQVKILDFGLAKMAQQPVDQNSDEDDAVMGSVHFMAPEQFERGKVDQRTDLYALGAIFYYSLTQRYPFQGDTNPQVMVSHLYHRFTPLAKLRPDLPAFLPAWVEWLMARQAADRPESVVAAQEAYRSKSGPAAAVAAQSEPVAVAVAVDEPSGKVVRQLGPKGQVGAGGVVRAAGGGAKRPAGGSRLPPRPAPAPVSKGLPKWSYVTLPFLGVLVIGYGVMQWIKRSGQAERQQRFVELASEDAPEATNIEIRMLFDYLEDPQSSPGAAQALSKVKDLGYADAMIIDHLGDAKSVPARVNLTKVIGMRGLRSAFPAVLKLTGDESSDVRKAAWTSLGMMAPPDKVTEVLDAVSKANEKEIDFAEQAVISIVQEAKNPDQAGEPILNAYRAGLGSEDYRATLVRILGRLGLSGSLDVLLRAAENPSIEVRKAALSALAQWPTSDPLEKLASRFKKEDDPAGRLLLLMAVTQNATQTGQMSQQKRFESLKQLYAAAKDQREKDQAMAAISRVVTEEAATFFDELAVSEPKRKREATAVSERIQDQLKKAVDVGAAGELTVDKATYQAGGAMSETDGILVNWLSESDWASWMVRFEKAGDYEISITQACTTKTVGKFEILVAGQTVAGKAKKSGGPKDFVEVPVGKVTISQPGLFKLMLTPLEIPEDGSLFRFKSMTLKSVGG